MTEICCPRCGSNNVTSKKWVRTTDGSYINAKSLMLDSPKLTAKIAKGAAVMLGLTAIGLLVWLPSMSSSQDELICLGIMFLGLFLIAVWFLRFGNRFNNASLTYFFRCKSCDCEWEIPLSE